MTETGTTTYWDGIRASLLVLNPHVYYDPHGNYGKVIIPTGHWITVQLAVRSHGWEETQKIPEVRKLLIRLSGILDEDNDEADAPKCCTGYCIAVDSQMPLPDLACPVHGMESGYYDDSSAEQAQDES